MIKKVKWNNHKILNDLELDLTKDDGSPYKTIIIAGENGAGKTTILETISSFLTRGSLEPFEYIKYEHKGSDYLIEPIDSVKSKHGFHYRTNIVTGNKKNISILGHEKIEDSEDIRYYGCLYSKARSGFNTSPVRSITTQQLDIEKYENDNKDDFTSVKQLLVDIDSQDNSLWMKMTKENSGDSFDAFRNSSKLYRFEKAFNNFFENLKFSRIDTDDINEKRILFKKQNVEIPLDSLSTGEKQIVFRGSQLLKNSNNLEEGIVFIDEPELSMHPRWQCRILDYYKNLFTKNGNQFSQIIVATHSEYVISSALKDSADTLVIVLKEENNKIKSTKVTSPFVLPTITAAEVNYLAFGVCTSDYHIQLYGYLQTKIGVDTIKGCDDYIAQSTLYNPNIHEKKSSYTKNSKTYHYTTLPTYIRNTIDHPDPSKCYTDNELAESIKLLTELCK